MSGAQAANIQSTAGAVAVRNEKGKLQIFVNYMEYSM